MNLPTNRLLPLVSVARQLRVSTKWLLAEVEAGRVPHLRAGDRILLSPEAVEAVFVKRASAPPKADDPKGGSK